MKLLTTFWNKLDGKKTYVGLIIKAFLTALGETKPEYQGMVQTAMPYVDMWIIGAAAHKLDKIN